jgi:repressor LexA
MSTVKILFNKSFLHKPEPNPGKNHSSRIEQLNKDLKGIELAVLEYKKQLKQTNFGVGLMYTRIGSIIRKARIDRGFSQHELGAALGLTATAINYYEKGKRKISIEDIYRLAAALKKPVEYFLPDWKNQNIEKAHKIKTLNNYKQLIGIPVLGTIRAGEALFSEQNLLGYLPIPADKAAEVLFALQVKGNSMNGKGICDGDLVLIRRQRHVDFNGQIVCALINGEENALKIHIKQEDKIILRSANQLYPDIIIDNENSLVIQGVYAGIFKFP